MLSQISRKFIILVASVTALSACSQQSPMSWKEDARLPDGRVITLTRYQEFKGSHRLGDPPTESDYWLEFVDPMTKKKIKFSGKRELQPVAIFYETSKPRILTITNYGEFERRDCPEPPYFLFEFSDSKWNEIDIQEAEKKLIYPNITSSTSFIQNELAEYKNHLPQEVTFAPKGRHNKRWVIDIRGLGARKHGTNSCIKRESAKSIEESEFLVEWQPENNP